MATMTPPRPKKRRRQKPLALLLLRFLYRVLAVGLPPLAQKLAAILFTTPKRHKPPQAEKELLKTGVRGELTLGQGKIVYWRFGSSEHPLIVTSHGWSGRGGQFREFVPELLRSGFQVILFDHLGHGESSGKRSSVAAYADGILALQKFLESQDQKIEAFITHSVGGPSVLLILKRGLDLNKIVVIAPPDSLINYSKHFAKLLGMTENARLRMQQHFEKLLNFHWAEMELPYSVQNLNVKALFIHDEDDWDVALESSMAYVKAWPGSELLQTRGLGHNRILKDKNVVEKTVLFLKQKEA